MDHETRIACLMYADDCALFASTEADLQMLYTTLAEFFEAEGMPLSLSKPEASAYQAWINASEWLDPKTHHADGTPVHEATAFKYLGQRRQRKGARPEVNVRVADATSAWHLDKTKLFRNKRLSVKLRIQLYSCLVASWLLGAAEIIPMTNAEEKRKEAVQTIHFRRTHRVPYSMYVPNEPVRRPSEVPAVRSRILEARLRVWGQACRGSPHSFSRATMFGRAADERPFFEKKKPTQHVTLIKEPVTKLCEPEHFKPRDWSLVP